MTSESIPVLGAEQIRSLLRPREAVQAIEDALRAGLDPAGDPSRTVVRTTQGQFLLMPSEGQTHAGVKVATVAPDNPARGRPRIQGLYLLFDAATLSPVAVLDGIALTALRTPAVSVAAIRPFLLGDDRPLRVTVFGAGPQAVGHVETLVDTLDGHRAVAQVTYLVRRPEAATVPVHGTIPVTLAAAAGVTRATAADSTGPTVASPADATPATVAGSVDSTESTGVGSVDSTGSTVASSARSTAADIGSSAGSTAAGVVSSGHSMAVRAVAEADVIVCATTARQPLFDSALVRDDAVVVAVGSHEPDAREVDGALTERALVIVEDVATATREAGDILQAIDERHLQATDLISLRQTVTGPRPAPPDGPVLFKSTGMSWEDLVIATAIHHRWAAGHPAQPT